MKTVRLMGPMESIDFIQASRRVTFQRMAAQEVDDDFAAELVGKNPDKLTPAEAAVYSIPVFELVEGGKGPSRNKGGEEVDA